MAGPFDFAAFNVALDDSALASNQRRAAELEATKKRINLTTHATRDVIAVGNEARKSADTTRDAQLQVLGNMDSTIRKAQEAIKLSDSQNPLDRLQLWALQQGDPAGYTREGNTKRLQYLQDASASLGNRELLHQAGYMDTISGIQANLDSAMLEDDANVALLKATETAGKDAIDTAIAAQNARTGMLTSQLTMQQTAIENFTSEQLKVAQMAANESPGGTVNIGGVDVSAGVLEQRGFAIEDREYLSFTRALQEEVIGLSNMTLADIAVKQAEALASKDGMAVLNNGRSVSLARLNDQEAVLKGRDYTMTAQADSLAQMAEANLVRTNTKQAQTLSIPELNKVIMNGGFLPNGEQIDVGIATAVRENKVAAQNNDIQRLVQGATTADPLTPAVDHSTWLTSLTTQQGSPLAATIKQNQVTTNVAAGLLASGEPERIGAAMEVINASRENVEKAIDEEAKRLASGDADLATAYGYQIRGLPIPQEVISKAIITRASANKPIGEWLSGKNRGIFDSTFRAKMTELGLSMSGGSVADNRAQAAQVALDAVITQIGGGITAQLMTFQINAPGNPLKGVLTEELFVSLLHKSDEDGARIYQQAMEIDDTALGLLKTGQSPNPDPAFASTQAAQLYMNLEELRPGLGQKYLDWWNSPARQQMAITYNAVKSQSATTFTELSENSLVLPGVPNALADYTSTLAEGQVRLYSDDLQREHGQYISFGGDNSAKQAYLLQADKSLSDSERQQAFALLIQPLLDQVTANNMSTADASAFVDSSLKAMRPTDPVAKRIHTKLMLGRDASLEVLNDWVSATGLALLGSGPNDPILQLMKQQQLSGTTSQYAWYKELKGIK